MKSICEFANQRSELLLRNFRESIARQSRISAAKAFHEAVESPAPRFWVSEIRAARVVSLLYKGEDVLSGMHPKKQEMYMEIFRRVKEMRKQFPHMSLGDIVFEVVNSEAPSFYLTVSSAQKIIYRRKHSCHSPLRRDY